MLRVAIIASGGVYQGAAAWAAPTYAKHLGQPEAVSVLLPEHESPIELLEDRSKKYGFSIQHFPFKPGSDRKFVSQLKCQAFLFGVSTLPANELLLYADADTYCTKPLTVPSEAASAVLKGKIGLVADVKDRHCEQPDLPWYLAPHERATYVNSGIILASRRSLDLFETFLELSRQPAFLFGPFNDQKVINFAIGKYFKQRLFLLDKAYNGMRRHRSSATIIGHCGGGAGRFARPRRSLTHKTICANILGDNAETISNLHDSD